MAEGKAFGVGSQHLLKGEVRAVCTLPHLARRPLSQCVDAPSSLQAAQLNCTHRLMTWRERPRGSLSLISLDSGLEKQVQTFQVSQAPLRQFLSLLKTQKKHLRVEVKQRRNGQRARALKNCLLLLGPHFCLQLAAPLTFCYILGEANGRSRSHNLFPPPKHIHCWNVLPLVWTARLQESSHP